MPSRNISLDLEAYERLKTAKAPGESFSQTIKRLVQPPFDLAEWLDAAEKNPLSSEAVDAIEKTIGARSRRTRPSR